MYGSQGLILNHDLAHAPFQVGAIFDDMDDKFWFFQTLMTQVLEHHAPLKSKRVRPTQPAFMNSRLRKNVHLKAQLRNRYNKFPSKRNWETFRIQRNRTTQIRKTSIKSYIMERCSNKPDKTFYKTVKPFISTKPVAQAPCQLQIEERLVKNDKDIADNLNKYYVEIANDIGIPYDCTIENLTDYHYVNACIEKYKDHSSINSIKQLVSTNNQYKFKFEETTSSNVNTIFKNLDPSKSTGYDMLPPKIIKLSSPVICNTITNLMNDMLTTNSFPNQMKHAEIQPLHKKGSTLEMANYRPVSILTTLSKLFEKEINNQLKSLSDRVFTETLSAYRSNFSTQHVILQVTEAIKGSLDRKQNSGAVLTDLSKAFDCLPHDLIIAKLNAYNVDKGALTLISSYLRGRQQRVKIGNHRSSWLTLKKGVPQGSILGPVLFNFFINDLLLPASGYSIANYADDTTIIATAPTSDLLSNTLVGAVERVVGWFEENGMKANPSKFQYIVFGTKSETDVLNVNDTIKINPSNDVKLLGITLDQRLNFEKHISDICRKSAWQLYALRRISKYLSCEAKMFIFKSYIASNFNYCKVVWHFCSKKSRLKLEKLQERGLRIVLEDKISSYQELLIKCKLKSLHENRLQCLLLEVFQAVRGTSPNYITCLFKHKETVYNLIHKNQLLVDKKRTTCYGLNSFSYLGATLWNRLPNAIKDIHEVNHFKTSISNIEISNLENIYMD